MNRFIVSRTYFDRRHEQDVTEYLRIDINFGTFLWGHRSSAADMTLVEAATLVRMFESVPNSDGDSWGDFDKPSYGVSRL